MERQYEERNAEREMELLRRIEQIEEDSKNIKRMEKQDYVIAGIITIFCFVAVIAGAFVSR